MKPIGILPSIASAYADSDNASDNSDSDASSSSSEPDLNRSGSSGVGMVRPSIPPALVRRIRRECQGDE